ncbi:hypothetical protein Y032_0252g230 [Ancylostoma ceylanicum]|uniref:SCP domain-containing protein n=1 Tax=Ancylostoma ceylanicum TaxID=53326 RepID=A0A016SCN8_9BILA|nr:hypothetical protein Y032_0252g230 [Ancylostoma ceylanicum]
MYLLAQLKLLVLRAWNVQPATEARMAWVKKQDNYSYFIVGKMKNIGWRMKRAPPSVVFCRRLSPKKLSEWV